MDKKRKNNVLAGLIVLAFVGLFVVDFNKADSELVYAPEVVSGTVINSELTGTAEDYFQKVQVVPLRDAPQFYTEPFAASKDGINDSLTDCRFGRIIQLRILKPDIRDSLTDYFTENTNY